MSKTILILFTLLIVNSTSGQDVTLSPVEIQQQIVLAEEFINEQNEEFHDPEKSPLPKDSISFFHGLDYFPINAEFIVPARFERLKKGKTFEMKTSTERLPVYKDFGILHFKIKGKDFRLHVYQNVELSKKEGYEDYLFIPFNDHTNGIESYGGGRYIDIRDDGEESIVLNFNMSYNPYCAYNDLYSCPVPPDENKLSTRIEAGVKKFH